MPMLCGLSFSRDIRPDRGPKPFRLPQMKKIARLWKQQYMGAYPADSTTPHFVTHSAQYGKPARAPLLTLRHKLRIIWHSATAIA
jgi:hypothetical protein